MNITLFNKIQDPHNPKIISLSEALDRIKTGKYSKELVTQLFNGDDKAKGKLPCHCLGGTFTKRDRENLVTASGLMPLDFDHTKKMDNPSTEAKKLREQLKEDEYIYSAWMSPSMKGVKALVKIPVVKDDEEYKQFYNALLVAYPDLDTSTTDISRVSYESYDPNLWVNESSKVWEIKADITVKKSHVLDVPIAMMKGAVKGTRHNTLIRAAKLSGGYIGGGYIEEDEAISLLEDALGVCGFDTTNQMHFKTIKDGVTEGMKFPIVLESAVENRLNLTGESSVKFHKFIRKSNYGWNRLEDFYDGKVELGIKIGIDFWDMYWRWKKNEFYSITSPKGRGKTLIVTALQVIANVTAKWKWIIAAQENPVDDYKENLLRYLAHDDVKALRESSPEVYIKVKQYIDKHFIFIDVDTIEEALETSKFIVESNPDETFAVFMDPINSFMAGYGYKGQVEYSNGAEIGKKILDFTMNVCTVVITQHTIISKQREGAGVVSSVHSEGGWFLNKSSYTATLNREQGSNESTFNIDNVRNRKTGGKETKISNPLIIEWSPYDVSIRMTEMGGGSQKNIIQYLQIKNKVLPLEIKPPQDLPKIQPSKEIF